MLARMQAALEQAALGAEASDESASWGAARSGVRRFRSWLPNPDEAFQQQALEQLLAKLEMGWIGVCRTAAPKPSGPFEVGS